MSVAKWVNLAQIRVPERLAANGRMDIAEDVKLQQLKELSRGGECYPTMGVFWGSGGRIDRLKEMLIALGVAGGQIATGHDPEMVDRTGGADTGRYVILTPAGQRALSELVGDDY